ncbi:MAG: UDP-N-acetylmuramoyl-tripeptide--D-alanyl-D-alanine ligase [Lachnospiraceae bacterium]|nr:UDP-N-acetylmuramoyl-tripeptide--D-alanyl-D-alanine ligase [Lachnospiraceae bacterium]
MLNLELINVIDACGGKIYLPEGKTIEEYSNKRPEGVVLDSREVKKDYIFVAYKGERVDGHDFIPQVIGKGAMAVICERVPNDVVCPCIKVEDSLKALTDIAAYYREKMNIITVGIVGSVGKTSTKEMVAGVLSQKYRVMKGLGNHNNLLGLSLEILRLTSDIDMAVLEMGISDFGEMRRLAKLVRPNTVVFTNIGECHLEFLGDRDGVLKAKTECFEYMDPEGYVVLNGLDDKLATISEVNGKKPVRCGAKDQDVYAEDIKVSGVYGSTFTLNISIGENETGKVHTGMPGAHMVGNALEAAAVGKIYGLTFDEIAKGIEETRSLPGRSNIIDTSRYLIIDDCYNANGASMRAAIDLLSTANGRKVAILGDMYELGERSDEIHKETGAYAVSKGIEVLLCVGKNSKSMYEAAMGSLMCEMQSISYFETVDELKKRLPSILEESDTVLVKASHGMNFAAVVEFLKELK